MDLSKVRDADFYADPEIDESTKTTVGGLVSLLWYPLVIAWIIYYIVGCVSTGELLSTKTSFDPFPEDFAEARLLPPTTCIAPGGCWVHNMKTSESDPLEISGIDCYYVPPGVDFPEFMRKIFLTPDPVQALSVTFDGTLSGFALSYDQVRLKDLRTGDTVTRVRSRNASDNRAPRIYQGSHLMQLTETSRPGYFYTESWVSVFTTSLGGIPQPWNLCCDSTQVGLVGVDSSAPESYTTRVTTEDQFTLSIPKCQREGMTQATIAPFPTVSKVVVQDWVMQGFAEFGGIEGTISLFSILLLFIFKTFFSKLMSKGVKMPALGASE
mmetsp:Transcript_36380/g.89530  ORF Transcript_36380/g.89530 Transcript_36380/m.89530 type:complete len:325 (+) Transcript_36380:127-1101(+)